MTKPTLQISVTPGKDGKAYYLPLAPQSRDHGERVKIALRFEIKNADPEKRNLTITGIAIDFPGHDPEEMEMVPERNMWPETGKIAHGETAIWHNGSWRPTENDSWQHNQIYLDGPAPARVTIKVTCEGFTEPFSKNFDLIRWNNPTGDRALLMPFARHELAEDEYIVTSARHGYNGSSAGTQIYAYDISIQARVNGEWSRSYTGTATKNTDVRVFGRPIRAMAHGEVIDVERGFGPGPVHSTEEGYWDNDYGTERAEDDHYGSNHVWVRYGDLEVKYSHLKRGSIVVEKGDEVWPGRRLAEAGNSGNTGGSPHLHMECRVAATNGLCGMTFRNTWQLERSLVPADNGAGRRVRIDDQGICEQAAALRPFATTFVPPRVQLAEVELESIVGEVFGGISKGGDGFVIVNGKLKRVPPRGIRGALLAAISDIGDAEALDPAAAAKRNAAIRATVEKALSKL